MNPECLDEGMNVDQPDKNTALRTSDVYRVKENLPKRFNNPDWFKGYSKKMVNPLYETTNQIYGSKKPTVHEMPITFNGRQRKFSNHMLKSGMFRDNGFNTSLDKTLLTGPNSLNIVHDRINFHRSYNSGGKDQAETNIVCN